MKMKPALVRDPVSGKRDVLVDHIGNCVIGGRECWVTRHRDRHKSVTITEPETGMSIYSGLLLFDEDEMSENIRKANVLFRKLKASAHCNNTFMWDSLIAEAWRLIKQKTGEERPR